MNLRTTDGLKGFALELGVKLARQIPRMVGQFDHSIKALSGEDPDMTIPACVSRSR